MPDEEATTFQPVTRPAVFDPLWPVFFVRAEKIVGKMFDSYTVPLECLAIFYALLSLFSNV